MSPEQTPINQQSTTLGVEEIHQHVAILHSEVREASSPYLTASQASKVAEASSIVDVPEQLDVTSPSVLIENRPQVLIPRIDRRNHHGYFA